MCKRLTPSEIVNLLVTALRREGIRVTMDSTPTRGNCYTVMHTAGTLGQMQRGVLTIIYWERSIRQPEKAEANLLRALERVQEKSTYVTWELRDAPETYFNHQDQITTLSQRVHYQILRAE